MKTFASITKPNWATNYGYDKFGQWSTFQVNDVVQRLRWIPPGNFLMGSPDNEKEHWPDESPQHEVTIKSGFWMFDTPCTQSLWESVMGENPSYFRGPTLPVEQVSWNDVQAFIARIAMLIFNLRLKLPTEEQWEYACRAGTTTAQYGDLDQIAWYFYNSESVPFRPERKTYPVGLKQSNNWGLYDMLGNIWEWCDDKYRAYESRNIKTTDHRVIRGGTWDANGTRYARAALRDLRGPSYRSNALGFRLVLQNR